MCLNLKLPLSKKNRMNPIIYSVSKNKCPRCHQGDVFVHGHAYKKGFDQMHTHCSNCHLKYEKEPGFFYGAMYVSYALTVAIFVTVWVLNLWFLDLSTSGFIIAVVVSLVGLMTVVFRVARLIWLNFFVRYNKEMDTELKS
jgi:uncharacterized protein (DUF983 family)